MIIFAATITAILVVITFIPMLPIKHWLVKVWEFPRLQICFLLILHSAMLTYLYASQPIEFSLMLGFTALSLLYHLCWIFPYTPFATAQVSKVKKPDKAATISILTSNVLMTNQRTEKLIALINKHQPDVLVTLETNQWWQDQLAVIHSDYPHRVAEPLENLYGIHLYSKLPLKNTQVRYLVEDDVPSIHSTITLPNGTEVECHFLHPAPPSPTENESSKQRDQEMLGLAKIIAERTHPIIVTGDLNDVAWSPTTKAFRRKSGLLDPRIGRGAFNTFHADYPFARWSLDHLFHSHHFKLVTLDKLEHIGSDHFPLMSQLVITQD